MLEAVHYKKYYLPVILIKKYCLQDIYNLYVRNNNNLNWIYFWPVFYRIRDDRKYLKYIYGNRSCAGRILPNRPKRNKLKLKIKIKGNSKK